MANVAVFSNWIKPDSQYPPEANRYHLYVSYTCPFASRAVAVYCMKGLEDAVGLSVCHPVYQFTKSGESHRGWVFRSPQDPPLANTNGHGSFPCDGCIPDTVNGFATLREVYESSGMSGGGAFSVPVLYDKQSKSIVSNDSAHIAEMLATQFNQWATGEWAARDLVPEASRGVMSDIDKWVDPDINTRVYQVALAQSQAAYDNHLTTLFAALDKAELILSKQRFLCGNNLTVSDIKLFTSLIRFDPIYFGLFRCSKRALKDYPNLEGFMRDIYQQPSVSKSVYREHIFNGYHGNFINFNPFSIIPTVPEVDLSAPHCRENLT